MASRSSTRLITAVILLLAGLTALVMIRNQRNSRAAAENKPAQIFRGRNRLPARDQTLPLQPQSPQNDPGYPMMYPPVAQGTGETELNIPAGVAPVPPEGKAETYPLPAQATGVHSIAEAGTMGVMANPAGQAGLPQVHALPPEALTQVNKQDVQSVTAPLGAAGNVIGTPPGVPPDEVGRSNTVPVKK